MGACIRQVYTNTCGGKKRAFDPLEIEMKLIIYCTTRELPNKLVSSSGAAIPLNH